MAVDELSVRITARDELTGRIRQTRQALSEMTRQLVEAQARLSTPGGQAAYDRLRSTIHATSSELSRLRQEAGRNERAIRALGQSSAGAGQQAGDVWGRLSGTLQRHADLIRGIGLAGSVAFGMLVRRGIDSASQMQQSQIAFTTMLGSAEKAKDLLAELSDFAAHTPFELRGLTQTTQRLLAFGFGADQVIPMLTAFGDAAAGLGLTSEGLDRIVVAVGQIQAKGKVQGDEILQLTEAGIPALQILADTFGVTTAQMQDMISDGAVPAQQAIDALVTGLEHGTANTRSFGGMMAAQSATLSGIWSNFTDSLDRALGGAMTNVIPQLSTLVGLATGAVTAFGALPGPVQTIALALAGLGVAASIAGPRIATAIGFVRAHGGLAQVTGVNAIRALGTAWQYAGQMARQAQGPTAGLGARLTALHQIMGAPMTRAVNGLRSAMGGLVGVLGGPWGIAITAVVTGLGLWWSKQKDVEAGAQALADTMDRVTGQFTAASRESVVKGLLEQFSAEDWEKIPFKVGEVADALLAGGDALAALQARVRAFQGTGGGAYGGDTPGKLYGQALANTIDDWTGKTAAARAEGEALAEANRGQGQAAAGATGPTAALGQAVAGAGTKAAEAVDHIKELKDQFEALTGKTRSWIDAQAGLYDAIDSAATAVDKKLRVALNRGRNGFDLTTESGRKAAAALGQIASSAEAAATAAADQGRWGKAKAVLDAARGAISRQAHAWGMGRDRADAYARAILGIPQEVTTNIRYQKVAAAQAAVEELKRRLKALNGTVASVEVRNSIVTVYGSGGRRDYGAADGGPVGPGATWMVGERGPELVVPARGDPYLVGEHGTEFHVFPGPAWVVPHEALPRALPAVTVTAPPPVTVPASTTSVHIDRIEAAADVDVEAALLAALARRDRLARERR